MWKVITFSFFLLLQIKQMLSLQLLVIIEFWFIGHAGEF